MSDRYENEFACGIEPEREGEEPTLEQWRTRCRQLWRDMDARIDGAYIAGLKAGYNLGLTENHERLNSIINRRFADRVDAAQR